MRTAELSRGLLDYWVARAEGHEATLVDGRCLVQRFANGLNLAPAGSRRGLVFEPSTSGMQGQPIMERNRISTSWEDTWASYYPDGPTVAAGWTASAPRPAIPAVHCHTVGDAEKFATSQGMCDGIGRHSHGAPPPPRAQTALIAGMRCRVAMAFGDRVPT